MPDRNQGPSKTGVSNDPVAAPEGEPSLDELTEQLRAELDKVPADKLKEAQEQAKDLLEGDLKWADLMSWTPEQMHETAKEGYRQFDAGQYQNSELLFKGLTVLDPDNFYYHQMLGASFQKQDKYPEAIVEYSIAIDLNAEDITSTTNRGEVYFELKLWDLAEEDFKGAIELDPDEENRWANRARILAKKIAGIRDATAGKAEETE